MEASLGEGGFRNTALALQVRGTYKPGELFSI
jgi:hypothetical protein